jgi:toxin YoeB
MRDVSFKPEAWDDFGWWAKNNPKMLSKIFNLLDNTRKTPFQGLGKPEPLKGNYSGYWSRRITDEHRLIYEIADDTIFIISAKGHYLK